MGKELTFTKLCPIQASNKKITKNPKVTKFVDADMSKEKLLPVQEQKTDETGAPEANQDLVVFSNPRASQVFLNENSLLGFIGSLEQYYDQVKSQTNP